MTALLWTVLALILIFAIARYNSSNKLFWELVTAYFIGMGVCYCAKTAFFEEEVVIEDNVKVSPIQGLDSFSMPLKHFVTEEEIPTTETVKSKLVGWIKKFSDRIVINNQVETVGVIDTNGITYNPPNKLCYIHTSTPVDSHNFSHSLAHLSINL